MDTQNEWLLEVQSLLAEQEALQGALENQMHQLKAQPSRAGKQAVETLLVQLEMNSHRLDIVMWNLTKTGAFSYEQYEGLKTQDVVKKLRKKVERIWKDIHIP